MQRTCFARACDRAAAACAWVPSLWCLHLRCRYTLFGTCGLTGPGGTWEEPPQASPSPVPEEPPPESPEPEEPPPPLPSPSPRITLNPLPANWSGSSADLLLAFKSSFLNGEAALSDWTNEEGAAPCDWPGVRCNSMEEVTGMWVRAAWLEVQA